MALNAGSSKLHDLAPVVVKRVFFVGLFVVAYLVIWHPTRGWIASEVMKPALSWIDTPRSDRYSVDSFSRGITVRRVNPSRNLATMKTPTGGFFVLAGMFLIALYPRDPYWLYVAAYQIGLGTFMFGMLAVGVGWADWGFTVFQILEQEFYQGTSLAVPFLLLRADGRALFGAIVSDAGRAETETSEE